MANKVLLKNSDGTTVMPITRGELILDSSGNPALHSFLFLATDSLPGLMSAEDKVKLDDLEKVTVEDKKVELVNTTTNDIYRLLFSSTADDTTRTEGARKSANLLFNPYTGVLTAEIFNGKLDWSNINDKPNVFTPAQHTHTTNDISSLLNYTKATNSLIINTSDSLNEALGKLEYKADLGESAYNIISAAYDGDGAIENLNEILQVLEGISDTTTILSILGNYVTTSTLENYVTTNTWLTISGRKEFSSSLYTSNIIPNDTEKYILGSSTRLWSEVYAKDFFGNLTGNASTASKVNNALTITLNGTSVNYDGSSAEAITINTSDTKVTNTLNTSKQFYITGTDSATTNTGTLYFDTGIYATTTPGDLSVGSLHSRGQIYSRSSINLADSAGTTTYGQFYLSEGTSSAVGYTCLNIGNSIATGKTGNSRGMLRLYNQSSGYSEIKCGTDNTSTYQLYLPGDSGLLVYHTNNTAVGSSTNPVYITDGGKATACSGMLYTKYWFISLSHTSGSGLQVNGEDSNISCSLSSDGYSINCSLSSPFNIQNMVISGHVVGNSGDYPYTVHIDPSSSNTRYFYVRVSKSGYKQLVYNKTIYLLILAV